MAVMVAIGSVASLLASGKVPRRDEKVAVFSDALNHASIIDGLRVGERLQTIETYIYRHCDMPYLDSLLSKCTIAKKVVVTDSLFSRDGDFAPMVELSKLRKKHGFLLDIDDAHGTFVCGKTGAGVAEEFDCENDVDICIGTLSKAAGCSGGFITCRCRLYILPMHTLCDPGSIFKIGIFRNINEGIHVKFCITMTRLSVLDSHLVKISYKTDFGP